MRTSETGCKLSSRVLVVAPILINAIPGFSS